MPSYDADPPIFFDSEIFYDDEDPPLTPIKLMAKIARNWNKKPLKQRRDFFQDVIDGLTANPHVTTPNPTIAVLTAQQAKLVAAIAAVDALELDLKAARALLHEEVDKMSDLIEQEAPTVEGATGGDTAKILTTNYEVTDSAIATPKDVKKLERFGLTSSDFEGAVDVNFDRDPSAVSFECETTTTPNDAASWVKHPGFTKSRATLKGLPLNSRIYVRARGVGPNGAGPWSDILSKVVG